MTTQQRAREALERLAKDVFDFRTNSRQPTDVQNDIEIMKSVINAMAAEPDFRDIVKGMVDGPPVYDMSSPDAVLGKDVPMPYFDPVDLWQDISTINDYWGDAVILYHPRSHPEESHMIEYTASNIKWARRHAARTGHTHWMPCTPPHNITRKE